MIDIYEAATAQTLIKVVSFDWSVNDGFISLLIILLSYSSESKHAYKFILRLSAK
jgi:hypothetical protein